jgi:small subunit ribosomal protein S1
MLKQGDRVDAVILSIKPEERRIALGLKQTLTDPWTEARCKIPHWFADSRPRHQADELRRLRAARRRHRGPGPHQRDHRRPPPQPPQDVLRAGQVVKAQVLAIDVEKRQIKLSMKQLIPTASTNTSPSTKWATQSPAASSSSRQRTFVELGDGIRAVCSNWRQQLPPHQTPPRRKQSQS